MTSTTTTSTSTVTRIPDPIHGNETYSEQMQRIEADLARIVGPRGTQALLERSRQLCGSRAHSRTLLLHNLLQLVRKLLGKPLAQWLLQSASVVAPVSRSQQARARLR
jgi:hypothetical protein